MHLRVLSSLACVVLLADCAGGNACDEFAAPHDRDPGHCPTKTTTSQAVKPDPNQPNPNSARYCYSSLAQVECYDTPQPGHETGYTGTYQPGNQPPHQSAPPAPTAP